MTLPCVSVRVCEMTVETVECSELLPEGGRDRIAKLFYYPVFAEGEQRASLGNLFKDGAGAGQPGQLSAEGEAGQLNLSNLIYYCLTVLFRVTFKDHYIKLVA